MALYRSEIVPPFATWMLLQKVLNQSASPTTRPSHQLPSAYGWRYRLSHCLHQTDSEL